MAFCIIRAEALQNELCVSKNIRFGNEGDDLSIPKYNAVLKTIETGSITAAAEQLGYTQSAVSRMIADLASERDMELLRRSRSGITISTAGQQLPHLVRNRFGIVGLAVVLLVKLTPLQAPHRFISVLEDAGNPINHAVEICL